MRGSGKHDDPILRGLLGEGKSILFIIRWSFPIVMGCLGGGKTGGLKEIGVLGTVFLQNFRLCI